MHYSKTALVTGANKGIGFAIARELGVLGYTVAVGARDDERREQAVEALRSEGLDVFGVKLDVASDESVTEATQLVTAHAERLDVLINNAGISGAYEHGEQNPLTLDLATARSVLETNVFGVVRVINAFLPLLQRSPEPRIVNMSSDMGSLALQTGPILAAYAPSKTMVNAITTQYARALADTPIIINAACPGYTATDFTGHAGDRTPAQAARIAITLATLPDDGPRGGFFNEAGPLPW